MKIHIDKKETTEKKGLFSSVKVTQIIFKFELNEDEQLIVDKNPDILKINAMNTRQHGLDFSWNIGSMIAPKIGLLVAYNSGELINYENQINEVAKKLKAHIMSLTNSGTGTTITEI